MPAPRTVIAYEQIEGDQLEETVAELPTEAEVDTAIDDAIDTAFAGLGDAAFEDYVEGTFTPVLSFGGGVTGITYAASTGQLGRHTKLGRMVFFQIRLVLTSKGSDVGAALISGLPFTTEALPNATGSFLGVNLNTVTTPLWSAGASGTSLGLFDGSTALNDTDFNDNSQVLISGSYMAV